MKEQMIEDPKKAYDQIMSQAAADVAATKGDEEEEKADMSEFQKEIDEIDEDADEAEDEIPAEEELKEIDKSMGEEKIPVQQKVEMTIEQHQKQKVAQAQQEAIKNLMAMKKSGAQHLTQEQVKTMTLVLAKLEKKQITNPVLMHLALEKVKLSKTFIETQVKAKELQQQMLNKISELTNGIVKTKGAIENIDQQILDLVNQDPSLLE